MDDRNTSPSADNTLDPNDPVARYLESLGHVLQPYYFLDSDWQIGYQVQLGTVRIAFRTEGDTVIICDLVSTSNELNGLTGSVARFLRFAREIMKLSAVQRIKGMMLDQIGSAEEQAKRATLAEVFIKQGAVPVFEGPYRWLVLHKQTDQQRGQATPP